MASVADLVKTISSTEPALRKRARLPRLLVGFGRRVGQEVQAAMDVGIVRLHMFAMASITARGFCAEAALSR